MSTARHHHLRATWVALVVLSALLAVSVVGYAADSEAAGSAGKIDLNRLSDDQLARLARGEKVMAILATGSGSTSQPGRRQSDA